MSKNATVMTTKQCLYSISIPLFSGGERERKGPFAFFRNVGLKTPGAHKQLPVWCLEMWHRTTNKSQSLKGYILFHSCSLRAVSHSLPRTHISPTAIGCLSSMYPSNSTSSPNLTLCLPACITGLTDSIGAKSLPQLWRSALVSNSDLCVETVLL